MLFTVRGPINSDEMGKTLAHEHILIDFSPADEQIKIDDGIREEIVRIMFPYLKEVKDLGFSTIFDCSAKYLGRDVKTLKILSEKTGLNIVTNTGFYAFGDYKHIPISMRESSPEEFASIWINEWKNGIEDTGIKPGFIKTSVNHGPLKDLDQRIIIGCALTHLETGLTISCHTGEKECALGVAKTVLKEGLDPSALIIVHADAIEDFETHLNLLEEGFWLEYDSIGGRPIEYHVDLIDKILKHGFINKILLSHDSGWYTVGEKDGGGDKIRGYTDIALKLIPSLEERGFSKEIIDKLLIENPKEAFDIRVRKR